MSMDGVIDSGRFDNFLKTSFQNFPANVRSKPSLVQSPVIRKAEVHL